MKRYLLAAAISTLATVVHAEAIPASEVQNVCGNMAQPEKASCEKAMSAVALHTYEMTVQVDGHAFPLSLKEGGPIQEVDWHGVTVQLAVKRHLTPEKIMGIISVRDDGAPDRVAGDYAIHLHDTLRVKSPAGKEVLLWVREVNG